MEETINLVDTHAHLELDPLAQDSANVVERASRAGVRAIICVGIDLEDAQIAIGIAEQCPGVFTAMGFHPHNADSVDDNKMATMGELAKGTKNVGYGEIGLDFFRNRSTRERQIEVFKDQLSLAKDLSKPVIIHLRDAYEEGLDILEAAAPFNAGGVIHCFSGNRGHAQRALGIGLYISIPGPVTYKKNDELRAIVSEIPDDKLLLETDCPFLAPEPFRGKVNEPALVVHTAQKIGEIKGKSLRAIAEETTANALALFGPSGLSTQ
jgi:TatD DNase family protein